MWYFLGYFNHASYEIPTDSSISGSLHVTVAMDNDIFSVPFFTLLDQFFRSIFPWHEITPISRILQLILTGWLAGWVEEFSAVKTVFDPVLFERIPTHTHNKNKSQLDHVSYGMVLAGDVISSLFMVLCWARALSCAVFPSSCRHHHHPSNLVVDVSARAKSLRK